MAVAPYMPGPPSSSTSGELDSEPGSATRNAIGTPPPSLIALGDAGQFQRGSTCQELANEHDCKRREYEKAVDHVLQRFPDCCPNSPLLLLCQRMPRHVLLLQTTTLTQLEALWKDKICQAPSGAVWIQVQSGHGHLPLATRLALGMTRDGLPFLGFVVALSYLRYTIGIAN